MNTCRTCGESLFLGLCERCARRAANDPAFAATDAGQEALAGCRPHRRHRTAQRLASDVGGDAVRLQGGHDRRRSRKAPAVTPEIEAIAAWLGERNRACTVEWRAGWDAGWREREEYAPPPPAAAEPWTIYQGECGHLWRGDPPCPTCAALREAEAELIERENAEREELEAREARLREALTDELFGLVPDRPDALVRIEEAVAAVRSRLDIEFARHALTSTEPAEPEAEP